MRKCAVFHSIIIFRGFWKKLHNPCSNSIKLKERRLSDVKCIIVSPCSWPVRTKLQLWSLEPWPNTTWRVSRPPTTSWCRSSLRREVRHSNLCIWHIWKSCLGLLWWNANITFTIFFPSFSRIGHPRQRQRVLRHEHICELWLPLASAWFWGEAGSAAQSLQLHTTAHTATLQSVPQDQQGHTVTSDLFLDQNRLCKKTTAGGVLENSLYRLFQGEFIDFRNISELI